MSSGGGKSGKNTTQTESQQDLPAWIKEPAIRNLQRAEDVQRIEYMPYRGAEIAAFNDVQNLAMNNNLNTARAFGLLDPSSTLTAESQMPTPTEFDGGFKGYSSMSLYDQALAETKAQQPGAIAQYEALFGAPAMAQLNAQRTAASRSRSGAPSIRPQTPSNFTPNYNDPHFTSKTHLDEINATGGGSSTSILDASYGGVTPTGTDYSSIKAGIDAQQNYEQAAGIGNYANTPSLSSRLNSKGYTPTNVSRPIDEIVAGYRSKK